MVPTNPDNSPVLQPVRFYRLAEIACHECADKGWVYCDDETCWRHHDCRACGGSNGSNPKVK